MRVRMLSCTLCRTSGKPNLSTYITIYKAEPTIRWTDVPSYRDASNNHKKGQTTLISMVFYFMREE